ncbi:RibD family protein, partial [Nonlabens mediterrranea]|nr:RibD family protein [Nonlabens mediterrranea]
RRSSDLQQPVWITNKYSRQLSHQLRAEEDAILVGAKTVIDDNPSLTCRDWSGKNPTRVILDSRNSITSDYHVMDDAAPTLKLQLSSSNTLEILSSLYQNNVQSVIIEGGTTTIQSFIDAGLWDEAYQFMGTEVLFHTGLKAPVLNGNYHIASRQIIANDVLKTYRNT